MGTAENSWREHRYVGTGTFQVTDRMWDLTEQILGSGRISYGPISKQFELEFAEKHDCKYAILSNSGTSALHVALQALKELHGWADGDEVIVPATTFVATANIVLHNRMIPVFVDIEPNYYNINPELIEQAITPKTRAIIPVHLFGQAANMTRITDIATLHSLRIIEDSCETLGVRHHGHMVGSMSDIGCFSFYMAHLITAGVGGMSTTSNPDYAAKMRSLVNHGLAIEQLSNDENFAPEPMIGRRFEFALPGHSFRITEFEAALGLAGLEILDETINTRQFRANHLTAGIDNHLNPHLKANLQSALIMPGNEHARMMYPIVLLPESGGELRDKRPLTQCLNDHGIETRDCLPLLRQPAYNLNPLDYQVSDWLDVSGFYVGCHQNLTRQDIQYVIDIIGDYFDKIRHGL
jgi:perosamine synthetase